MRSIDQKLLDACQNDKIRTAQKLLQQGANPNSQEPWWSKTPLMSAARNGNIKMLQLLIQHGANPHITDRYGRNALYYAVENGHYHAAKYLLTQLHLDPNTQDDQGNTPFLFATLNGDLSTVQLLIQHGANPYIRNSYRETVLHCALKKCHHHIAEYLLTQLHLNPNTKDNDGITPFMLAAKNGDIPTLQRLLQHGANPYITDRYGQTALHYAVKNKQYDTAQYLITQLHLDPNTKDQWGKTPLVLAIENRDITMVKLLTQLGVNPHITDIYGESALHDAVRSRDHDIARYLLTVLHLDPNAQNKKGITPFILAAVNYDIKMLQLLLQHGANPYTTDNEGKNALHYAEDYKTAQFLISVLHLNPNTQDHHGNTPLLTTRQNRSTHTAQTLIQLGAHPNIPNHQGQNPTTTTTIDPQSQISLKKPQPSTITI